MQTRSPADSPGCDAIVPDRHEDRVTAEVDFPPVPRSTESAARPHFGGPGEGRAAEMDGGGRGRSAVEALALAREFQCQRRWRLARQILEESDALPDLDPAARRAVRQQRAVCTYKDRELRLVPALEQGLAVLASCGEDLATTRDPETLGIAGAIHKRMWEVSGRRQHLLAALGFYLRGAECAEGRDQGYNAINAAYVLDAVADLDERSARAAGLPDLEPSRRRAQASELTSRDSCRPPRRSGASGRPPDCG